MDIDEFLDRELADVGLDTNKPEKSSDNLDIPFKKPENSLLETAKSDVRRSSLELTEQAYNQLWRVLMEQKLKWNKEVHEQLSNLSRQFSGMLSQSYDEVKRKANHINDLLARARNALKDKKKGLALKIYSDIRAINNSIPDTFFEDKKLLQDKIMDFYKEMMDLIDNEQIAKVSSLTQEISRLLDRINSSIKSNNFAAAGADYLKCIELYSQIPEGFLKSKNALGMRILDIYKNLSIYSEITNLQSQMGQQIGMQQVPMSVLMQRPLRSYQRNLPPKRMLKSRLHRIKIAPKQASIQKDEGKVQPAIEMVLAKKRENAKKNIKKGFYNEAWKDIEEALQIDPHDVESITLRAKIKTLQ